MKILLIFALLLLSGCATQRATVVPVEVKIPIAVPCKTPEITAPAFAVDALPLGSDIWTQMAALRAERWQRKGYIEELESAVKACRF